MISYHATHNCHLLMVHKSPHHACYAASMSLYAIPVHDSQLQHVHPEVAPASSGEVVEYTSSTPNQTLRDSGMTLFPWCIRKIVNPVKTMKNIDNAILLFLISCTGKLWFLSYTDFTKMSGHIWDSFSSCSLGCLPLDCV
ncbi:Rna polymerase Ii-Associated Protein 1 [Manis pentadactyla]|nr:Rna polymerase Ii-Associated Protein 1 [Manis pentadactyla]